MPRTGPLGAGPLVDRGDVNGGFAADGEFVMLRGHSPVALESADTAFDGVALLVTFARIQPTGWPGRRQVSTAPNRQLVPAPGSLPAPRHHGRLPLGGRR